MENLSTDFAKSCPECGSIRFCLLFGGGIECTDCNAELYGARHTSAPGWPFEPKEGGQVADLFRADDFTLRRIQRALAKDDPGFDLGSLSTQQFATVLEAVFSQGDITDRTTTILAEACARLRRLDDRLTSQQCGDCSEMTPEQVDAELRAVGLDPVAVGARLAAAAAGALAMRKDGER